MTTVQNGTLPNRLTFQGPGTYRIRLQGKLAEHWYDGLGEIRSISSESPEHKAITTLTGQFRDQAALLGLLNTIYNLHLPLLQVEYLTEANGKVKENRA